MKKGFTLIELLVIVLIIGILAAVALPQYQVAVAKTRVKSMLVIMKSIVQAQRVYYLANNQYTGVFSKLDIEIPVENSSISCISGYNGGAYNSVYCAHNSVPNLKLERYYDHEENLCWAQSEEAAELCKFLCGTNVSKGNFCTFTD